MDRRIIEPHEPIDTTLSAWTATKINALLHCAQQYWYSTHSEYIPKELLPPTPSQLVQGSFLHDWAEHYTTKKPNERTYELVGEALAETMSYIPTFTQFLDKTLPEALATIFNGQPYIVEVESKLALDPKLVPTSFFSKVNKLFAGKIDYLALSEDKTTACVIDYKATYKTDLNPKDYELQLALYGFLLSRHYRIKNITTGIYFIRQNQLEWLTPVVAYDDSKSIALIRSYMETARAAAAKKDKRTVGPHCDFCQFKSVCLNG